MSLMFFVIAFIQQSAMSTDWSAWAHVMTSTKGQWLPGDARGFRSHGHRVHSSGDYKNPPPTGEHAALRKHAAALSSGAVVLSLSHRATALEAITEKLGALRIPARAVAVGATHAHALILVGDLDAKALFGAAKQLASHRLRSEIPSSVWGKSSHVVRINDELHYRNVVEYIEEHRTEGAAVWVHPRWADPNLRKASGSASAEST